MKKRINEGKRVRKTSNKVGTETQGLTAGLSSQRRHLTKVSKDRLDVDVLRWECKWKGHLNRESYTD